MNSDEVVQEQAVKILAALQLLAEEISVNTERRCQAARHYVRARRTARSFLREARGYQIQASKASVKMYAYHRTIRNLQRTCDHMLWGEEPSNQVRRAAADLRAAEALIREWSTIPDPND